MISPVQKLVESGGARQQNRPAASRFFRNEMESVPLLHHSTAGSAGYGSCGIKAHAPQPGPRSRCRRLSSSCADQLPKPMAVRAKNTATGTAVGKVVRFFCISAISPNCEFLSRMPSDSSARWVTSKRGIKRASRPKGNSLYRVVILTAHSRRAWHERLAHRSESSAPPSAAPTDATTIFSNSWVDAP